MHVQNIRTQKFLVSVDAGMVKKSRKFRFWKKKKFLIKSRVLGKCADKRNIGRCGTPTRTPNGYVPCYMFLINEGSYDRDFTVLQ